MYIAAAFEYFIKSQNEFLDHIINNGENNKNIYYCIDNMKKRIQFNMLLKIKFY